MRNLWHVFVCCCTTRNQTWIHNTFFLQCVVTFSQWSYFSTFTEKAWKGCFSCCYHQQDRSFKIYIWPSYNISPTWISLKFSGSHFPFSATFLGAQVGWSRSTLTFILISSLDWIGIPWKRSARNCANTPRRRSPPWFGSQWKIWKYKV